MSNDKIHLRELGSFDREKYACNHAVNPRPEFLTKNPDLVTCQNCLVKLGKSQKINKSELFEYIYKLNVDIKRIDHNLKFIKDSHNSLVYVVIIQFLLMILISCVLWYLVG